MPENLKRNALITVLALPITMLFQTFSASVAREA